MDLMRFRKLIESEIRNDDDSWIFSFSPLKGEMRDFSTKEFSAQSVEKSVQP